MINSRALTLSACCAVFLYTHLAWAQRDLTDIPDPDPQKELEQLQVAEGFKVNLFGSDPEIAKPIQSNWDAKGRLWVATSRVYPQLEPGEVANDQIVILEDTDKDGQSDKSTVFADGLLIPTGVLPTGNGAYVANSTELLYMEDTDGDDVADTRRVVLSGFGTEDTHHILHTLRWGPGGYIYFNQSIYIHSNIETPWGPRYLDAGGIWRFRPSTLELEVWVRGFVNPWGHRFNDWGQEFATDGAFGEGVNYVFPGSAFVAADGMERILQGMSPGQPKHCGLAILSGEHLGNEAKNVFVTNDFRGHRVNQFHIEESESGYVARQLDDLLWTDHVAFRPIDASVGPDGAIYISDWYNPIIQHGEVDFRDPRRDRTHGRIWRVSREESPVVEFPNLASASASELVAALSSPNRFTRDVARQLIAEHKLNDADTTKLEALLRETYAVSISAGTNSDEATDRTALEALWALQSLGVYDDQLVEPALTSLNHRIRAAAVRLLVDGAKEHSAVHRRLRRAVTDEHPQVRLEAINGLRRWAGEGAVKTALLALDQSVDKNIDYALWLTMKELESTWLPEVVKDPAALGSVRNLVFALNATARPEVLPPALSAWKQDDLSNEDRAALAALIGRLGDPPALAVLAEQQVLESPQLRLPALDALLTAARQRNLKPANVDTILAAAKTDDADVQARALELVGRYQIQDGLDLLRITATNPKASVETRSAAIRGLEAFPGESAKSELSKIATAADPIDVRIAAIRSLANRDLASAARIGVQNYSTDGLTEPQSIAMTQAFLGIPKGPEALVTALNNQKIPEAIAAAALRAISTSTQQSPQLIEAFQTAGNVTPVMENLSPEETNRLLSDAQSNGNPGRGELVYRRDDLQCVKCHAIGGAGGLIGPDLTSIGASAQPDYLLTSLLQPSDKIKEGYHTTTVVRSDGTVVSGVQIRKTDNETVLRDNNGVEIEIPADDILDEAISPVSLMPQGLTGKTRRDELVDLLAFLSQLGRPGEFRVRPQPIIRGWRILNANDSVSEALRANSVASVARDPDAYPWESKTSLVSGHLPLADIPKAMFFNGQEFQIVQFFVETPQAGPCKVELPDGIGLSGFVGTNPVTWSNGQEIELEKGLNQLTIVIDPAKFTSPTLNVQVDTIPDSNARPQVVHQIPGSK